MVIVPVLQIGGWWVASACSAPAEQDSAGGMMIFRVGVDSLDTIVLLHKEFIVKCLQ